MFPRDPGQGKPTNVAMILQLKGYNMEGSTLTWLSFYTIQGFQHGRKPTNVAIILQHSGFSAWKEAH